MPFDRAGGELLFNVLSERHGRRSVVITTNLNFSEWPRVFGGDEKLTAALLDRLAEAATSASPRAGGATGCATGKGAATAIAQDAPPPEKGDKATRA